MHEAREAERPRSSEWPYDLAASHGAVIAREYGIPAVVGIAGATERIVTGQHITVDGAAGTVTIKESVPA